MSNPLTTAQDWLPSLWDRATGGRSVGTSYFNTPNPLGTPEPIGGVMINSSLVPDGSFIFEELSDSPTIEFGEQCTITHKFYVDYATGQFVQENWPRGQTMVDGTGLNLSRVLSTTLVPISKTGARVCLLTVVSEAESFANPPEEFNVETVELNPPLEKHPRYGALSYQARNAVRGADVSDFIDVQVQNKNLIDSLPSSSIQDNDQHGQALELLFKKQKGEDSFYLSGYKITYSKYFWLPPIINPGGYIEDPFTDGGLPVYFWSTTGDVDGDNIFSNTATINPNLYDNAGAPESTQPPYGLSWLRQTDTVQLNRTWYKLTATWIGGPLGHWDNELYSSTIQPLQTSPNLGGI